MELELELAEQQQQLRNAAIEFARAELNDDVIRRDRDEVFSIDGWKKCGRFGALFAFLKLRIFERIGKTHETVHELATQVDASLETDARFLNAGVVLTKARPGARTLAARLRYSRIRRIARSHGLLVWGTRSQVEIL